MAIDPLKTSQIQIGREGNNIGVFDDGSMVFSDRFIPGIRLIDLINGSLNDVNKIEIAGLTGSLQNQINNINYLNDNQATQISSLSGNSISQASQIAALSGATLIFTPLTTTAGLTGLLQFQIDSINVIGGDNISVAESPDNTFVVSASGLSQVPLTFTQSAPSATWLITHSFGYLPNVQITVGGEVVDAEIHKSSLTQVVIKFNSAQVGSVILN